MKVPTPLLRNAQQTTQTTASTSSYQACSYIRMKSSASFQRLPILHLPPIDASVEEECQFSRQLRDACHNVGFFYVSHHGVRNETYTKALSSSRQFFSLPRESKMSIDYRNSPSFRGYMAHGCENTAGRPDRREQIEFGVEKEPPSDEAPLSSSLFPFYNRLAGPNQWPEKHAPNLRPTVTQFMAEMEVLSRRIMAYLALSLDLPRNYFDDTFRDSPNVQLKVCRYPPDEDGDGFGVGAHTDSGYLSLLLQDEVGGLQVKNGSGEWIDAPPIDGTIVVNLGEMLQLVTSGYLLATPHRVINSDAQIGRARYSMPYFWNPRLDFHAEQISLPESLIWERPKPAQQAIGCTDSHGKAGNKLHACYGENAFKSLARSHPQVMERHHKDLIVLPDGTIHRAAEGN